MTDPPGHDKDASDLERRESLVHWLEDLYTSNPNQAQFKKKLKLLPNITKKFAKRMKRNGVLTDLVIEKI